MSSPIESDRRIRSYVFTYEDSTLRLGSRPSDPMAYRLFLHTLTILVYACAVYYGCRLALAGAKATVYLIRAHLMPIVRRIRSYIRSQVRASKAALQEKHTAISFESLEAGLLRSRIGTPSHADIPSPPDLSYTPSVEDVDSFPTSPQMRFYGDFKVSKKSLEMKLA